MWLTTREASDFTGLSESWLRKLARDGWVKARKKSRQWYFDELVLKTYTDDGWIGVREAGARTGYSEDWLRRLAREGKVIAILVSDFWLIEWSSLVAYRRDQGRQ
jgi:hypothetical protein